MLVLWMKSLFFFFFKQKTAYEMRISDWSSDVCSSDLVGFVFLHYALFRHMTIAENIAFGLTVKRRRDRPSKTEIARRVDELLNQIGRASCRERVCPYV